MPLALDVTTDDLSATFAVSGAGGAGSILGTRLTGDCQQPPTWQTVGTFTGDGTQTAAVARGPWVFVAKVGATLSDPQHVAIPDAGDNVHLAIYDAVVARLESLALPLDGGVQRRSVPENQGGRFPVCLAWVPKQTAETAGVGTNERSDWGYPVVVLIADRVLSKADPDVAVAPLLALRRTAFAAFDRHPRLDLPEDYGVFDIRVEPGPIRQDMIAGGGDGYHVAGSQFTVRAMARVRRGF